MQSWLNSYKKLLKFIQEHPEITIERSSVIIPAETRSGFYRLFDEARQSIVRVILDDSLLQAEKLSKKYLSAEKAIFASLKLEKVELSNPLGWFLRDPVEGLMRELFDPLFDLLKGRMEPEGFADYVTSSLRTILSTFQHQGYDKWLALSLISLLESDELFRVDVRRPAEHREWTQIRSNSSAEIVPEPQKSTGISFVHFPENLFNVPDFIVHSEILGAFIAFRSGINNAIATAIRPSGKRIWISLPETLYSESDPLLLYIDASPGDINLVADVKKISQPDMIVINNFIAQNSQDGFEQAVFWHGLLSPVKGTYIIGNAMTRVSLLPDGIKYIEAGLEAEKLTPVIDALKDR